MAIMNSKGFEIRFKIGDLVIAGTKITEEACGDHPVFTLAEKGQRLIVRNRYPAKDFPSHGVDSYSVQDENGCFGEFFMDCSELEEPTIKQKLKNRNHN